MTNANLHSHTYRCKHATGDAQDYAQAALKVQLHTLGITDHTPLPDDRWPTVRMSMKELDGYVQAVRDAKQKYPGLKILCGMECEWAEEYRHFYEEELIHRCGLDYLVGAVHYFPFNGGWQDVINGVKTKHELHAYTDWLIETMASRLFSFIAHPDLFANSYIEWDEDVASCAKSIFKASKAYNVPLEINVSGFRKRFVQSKDGMRPMYPWKPFWEVAFEFDVEVLVNSDAHRPEDIVAYVDRGVKLIQ